MIMWLMAYLGFPIVMIPIESPITTWFLASTVTDRAYSLLCAMEDGRPLYLHLHQHSCWRVSGKPRRGRVPRLLSKALDVIQSSASYAT